MDTENINIDNNLLKREMLAVWKKFLEVSISTHSQSRKGGISLVLEANRSLKSVVWKTRIFLTSLDIVNEIGIDGIGIKIGF